MKFTIATMTLEARWKRLRHYWRHDRDNLFQKIRKKARNRLPLDKLFQEKGRAFYPINLTFEMTHVCNLSCYMCDLYGTDAPTNALRSEHYSQEDLLTLKDLERILEEVQMFKPSISLTGGEPMLSPLTLPFIRKASSLNLVATLTSNGYQLEEKAEDLMRSGLRNLTLSLDGIGEIHDHIRGKKGSFETLIRGLKALQKKKEQHDRFLPSVQFNVTISGRNQNHLEEILDCAMECGVDRVIFSHLWYWDEKMVSLHNDLYGHLAPAEIQNTRALEGLNLKVLSESISKIKQSTKNKKIDIKFLPDLSSDDLASYYSNSLKPVSSFSHCLAPWMNTRILPNGDVIPCLDSVWGNLKRDRFSRVWNSPVACEFREALRQTGVFPGCLRCCGLYSYS